MSQIFSDNLNFSMNNFKYKFLIFIFLFIAILTSTVKSNQTQNAEDIIKKVNDKFKTVKDYQVDVKIKVDIEFLKVPDSEAKIYYKAPDKFKIKSDGFAMLPKEGINFNPQSLLKENNTSVFVKNEIFEGIESAVIKIIPVEEKNIVLSTVWIDLKNYVIRKVETTTKNNGSFTLILNYDFNKIQYPLPLSLNFTFDIKNMNFSKNIQSPGHSNKKPADGKKSTTGNVKITYNNYIVNKGVSDDIFK